MTTSKGITPAPTTTTTTIPAPVPSPITTTPAAPAVANGRPAAARHFPEMPPRGDMQNVIHLHEPGYITTLRRHLAAAAPDTTLVMGEIPLGWRHDQRGGLLIPDLIIAFGVDPEAVIAERGFSVSDWGKAPDFVLEVASIHTARNDETHKRGGYAGYGVTEYWRFDPTGGQRYRTGLAGDRLVDVEYQPIDIVRVDDNRYWGYSAALGLNLCWEYGALWWHDPVANRYLARHEDEINGRMAAEGALIISQAERDDAVEERDAAVAERDTVAAERDAAVAERDATAEERDAVAAERDATAEERDTIAEERDATAAERDAAVAERDAALAREDAARARELELEAEIRRLRGE